jgi:hypothetical protein
MIRTDLARTGLRAAIVSNAHTPALECIAARVDEIKEFWVVVLEVAP